MEVSCILSDTSSSGLTSPPSQSPSPPPELSNPTSLPSSQMTPTKRSSDNSGRASGLTSSDDDGQPPTKKRRVLERGQRATEYLDLSSGESLPGQEKQLDKLFKILEKKRKIVVIAGAGISVSAGIPDFRSSGGLFNSLRRAQNLKSSGKHLFDASVYKDANSTSSFHDMVRSLSNMAKSALPTPFHRLLDKLAREDRLLRLYSQNVDGIDTSMEHLATDVPLPIKGPWKPTIQLHGGLNKMVCSKCHKLSDFEAELFDGPIPPSCGHCESYDRFRTEVGMRSHGVGRLRPRMVLYNEYNPDDEAIGAVTKADLRTRPDALIVVGTSLKVPGVRRIAREMCHVVRDRRGGTTIWINNDPEPMGKDLENCWDLVVKGPCDKVADFIDSRSFRTVTDEDVRKAKECGRVEVVIRSSPQGKDAESQAAFISKTSEPLPSLNLDATLASARDDDPQKRVKTVERNPASVGKSLKKVLGPIKKPKTARTKCAVPKKPPTKPTQKISTAFKVSKTKAKSDTGDRKAPSKKAEPKSSSPPPTSRGRSRKVVAHLPMHPVSPQAAKNNTSPPFQPSPQDTSHFLSASGKPEPLDMTVAATSSKSQRAEIVSPTGPLPADHAIIMN